MTLQEIKQDLFELESTHYLTHCISADFGMGKGIAVEFNKHYNMKNKLQYSYPRYTLDFMSECVANRGDCILMERVFNLITKPHYFEKPTYTSMHYALLAMRSIATRECITKIAMPLIGCGLDKLEWNRVRQLIIEVFDDTEIDIVVCRL